MRLAPCIALVLVACGTDVKTRTAGEGGGPGDDDPGVDAGSTTVADARTVPPDGIPQGLTPCEEAVYHSDLTWVQRTVFDVSCATSDCHTGASPKASLDLTSGASHTSLVNMPSTQYSGWMRVTPNSSAQSMLMVQVGGEPGPELEGYMPWGQPRLCSEQVDAIRRWIAAGAPND